MYRYVTHPMFSTGGPLDHLLPYTGGGKLTPNQQYNNFLNEIDRLKIQKLNYPGIQPVRGGHPLLPKLDLNFDPSKINRQLHIENTVRFNNKQNRFLRNLDKTLYPEKSSFDRWFDNDFQNLKKNVKRNPLEEQYYEMLTERNKPKMTKWQKFVNSPFMKTTSKIAKRLDPFPWLMAPMYPQMFQDQNMMQPMRRGGSVPYWIQNNNPYI